MLFSSSWISLLFISFFISQNLYAQIDISKSCVIVNTGDTIVGEVKDYTNSSMIFKDKAGNKVKYNSNQIKSYSIEGINRISASVFVNGVQNTYFIKELLQGYVSLFELINREGEWQYILKKQDGNYIPLIGNEAYSQLFIILNDADDTKLKQMLESRYFIYNYSYFANIIKQYNRVTKQQESKEFSRKINSSFELIVGVAQNRWYNTYESEINAALAVPSATGYLTPYYFTPVGLSYTLNFRNRLSFIVELAYNQYSGERHYQLVGTTTYDYVFRVKHSYIKFGTLSKYVITNKKFRTYLKSGINLNKDLDLKISEERVNFWVEDKKVRKNMGYGYTIGVGTEKMISSNKAIYLEGRYSQDWVSEWSSQVGKVHSYQILLGLSFKK